MLRTKLSKRGTSHRENPVLNFIIVAAKGGGQVGEYSVYMHTNKINNKKYIGITKRIPEERWGVNGVNYKSTPHFWNSICKYGWENFDHTVLFSNLEKEDACEKEMYLIKKYKTQDNEYGYNIFEGGDAPSIPEAVRQKMSKSMMGNRNGKGHPCSEEKKKKISEAQKGRHLTKEHREKLSKAKKGGTHAPISAEARKKIADSHKKTPVYCLETNQVYESIQDCARQLNLFATNICKCCKGKIKSTGGFHLQYAMLNDDE